jgi:hypothetical protein
MMSVVALAAALLTGCGGTHDGSRAGLRIYDPSAHVKGQVTAGDVVPSSVRTGPESGGTAHTYFIYFGLTSRGRQRFHSLTRALARRGARLHRVQRFAFEVNGHVYGRPFIDYRLYPNGIDGSSGIEIPGVPPKSAKRVARELRDASR